MAFDVHASAAIRPPHSPSEGRKPPARFGNRLSLLASAIAGHRVTTGSSPSGTVYTDGQVIYLPEGSDDHLLVPLVVQAALLGHGSLEPKCIVKLLGQELLTARYLTLEAARVAYVAGGWLPRRVQEQLIPFVRGTVTRDREESLQRAMRERFEAGDPAVLGVIRPMLLLRELGRSGGSAATRAELRTAEQRVERSEDEEDEKSEKSWFLSRLAPPIAIDNPIGSLLKNLFGAKASKQKSETEGGAVELATGAVQWVRKVGAAAKIIGTGLKFTGWSDPAPDAIVYPEWDYLEGRFRPDCCHVMHYEPAATGLLGRGTPDITLTRRLARLGTTLVRHRRQGDGENLDNDALVNHVVDSASGHSGDERVYEARRKTGRDLSVLVLLDASGSTGDKQSGGATIWESQCALALNVVAALDGLGDSVAAYGFRSFGQTDVRFVRIKDFSERFGQAARSRLQSLEPAGFTRLGAAVRHGTRMLATRARTESQLLVVVSDGLPYDLGYEQTYAEQDVRHALGEAEGRGIGCVCLSIGSPRNPQALERVWGNVGHASLASPTDLNRFAEPLFRAALARSGNRSSQRPRATPGSPVSRSAPLPGATSLLSSSTT